MTEMLDMTTAPKDGTRTLILTKIFLYNNRSGEYECAGVRAQECWWDGKVWQIWCGAKTTTSTEHVEPLGWWPLPYDPNDTIAITD
jgi:hypothetical protein